MFAAIAIVAAFLNSAGMLKHEEITASDQVEQVNNEAVETQDSQQEIQQSDTVKALQENYRTLGNYRGQVNTVVSNFNNYHLASDKAKRQQYADECNELISSVTDSKAKLVEEMNELGMNENDDQFSNYTKINKLYELLLTRLNVIKECWEVSVASADPKKDAKAILAPLSKDIKGGKSSSMAEFDELYSQVELPR